MKLKQNHLIAYRGTATDKERVTELAKQTGLTVSEVLRQLVANAELHPISTFRPIATLSINESSDAQRVAAT